MPRKIHPGPDNPSSITFSIDHEIESGLHELISREGAGLEYHYILALRQFIIDTMNKEPITYVAVRPGGRRTTIRVRGALKSCVMALAKTQRLPMSVIVHTATHRYLIKRANEPLAEDIWLQSQL